MIKKVKTTDLKLSMYVHDLNVPWMDHGFITNKFLLEHESQIEKILQKNITEVLIDTEKGIDDYHAPTQEEAETALIDKIINTVSETSNKPTSMTMAEELKTQWAESRKTHTKATDVVSNILSDIRLGKQADVVQTIPAVSHIVDSVLKNDGTMVGLCRIKQRNAYTFQHAVSVSALLIHLCHSVGEYSNDELIEIGLGGLLHDVGKMKVPDRILNKPGSLTDEEYTLIKSHVVEGLRYLEAVPGLSNFSIKIVAEHHERYDGSGYPRGLSKNSISQLGQMASIVDVYDAITSIRCYHTGIEPSSALKRIFEWSGRHFDEELVQKFIKAIGIYPVSSLVRLESGRLAIVLRQGEKSMLQPLVLVVYNADRGHRLPPQELDLASLTCQDHIVGCEQPASWGINPVKFIESYKAAQV